MLSILLQDGWESMSDTPSHPATTTTCTPVLTSPSLCSFTIDSQLCDILDNPEKFVDVNEESPGSDTNLFDDDDALFEDVIKAGALKTPEIHTLKKQVIRNETPNSSLYTRNPKKDADSKISENKRKVLGCKPHTISHFIQTVTKNGKCSSKKNESYQNPVKKPPGISVRPGLSTNNDSGKDKGNPVISKFPKEVVKDLVIPSNSEQIRATVSGAIPSNSDQIRATVSAAPETPATATVSHNGTKQTNSITHLKSHQSSVTPDTTDSIRCQADTAHVTPEMCELSLWGLPSEVLCRYNDLGITHMFSWQAECLSLGKIITN